MCGATHGGYVSGHGSYSITEKIQIRYGLESDFYRSRLYDKTIPSPYAMDVVALS